MMSKEKLISEISIEFGLSKELSEKVIDSMFNAIKQSLKKDKILKLQKFGKFRLISEKDDSGKNSIIKYYPSKKIAMKVNGNFDNLRKVKQKPEAKDGKQEPAKSAGINDPEETILSPAENEIQSIEITVEEVNRVLISEDLIKLHEEITKNEKDEPVKDGLWR